MCSNIGIIVISVKNALADPVKRVQHGSAEKRHLDFTINFIRLYNYSLSKYCVLLRIISSTLARPYPIRFYRHGASYSLGHIRCRAVKVYLTVHAQRR